MAIYRADVVGSLLRPPALLAARERFQAGRLNDAAFKSIEDAAVDCCVALQERCGVDVLSDGEMRRHVFASQLVQAVDGFESMMPGVSDAAYPSTDAYMEDVADILRDEVRELVRLGCTYIQFDAPEFGMVLDAHQQEWFARKGFQAAELVHDGIELMNSIMAGYGDACTFGLHVCRGNDASLPWPRTTQDGRRLSSEHKLRPLAVPEEPARRAGECPRPIREPRVTPRR